MDSDIFTCIGCGLKSHIVKEQICGHVYCQHCISTAEAKGISVCTLEHLSDETKKKKKKKKKLASETKKEVEKICYFCNSKLDSDNIKSHYDVCDLFPVDCPNNCSKKCLRAQMNIHMQECPENLHTCPFLPLGCNFKGSPVDIAKHEEDKIHLKLMLNVLLKTEQTNATKMTDNVSSTAVILTRTLQLIEGYFNIKIVQDDLQKQIEKQNLEIDWCRKRICELEQPDWCKKILELEQQFDLEQNKNSSNLAEVFNKLQDLTVKNIIMEQSQATEDKILNDKFKKLKEQFDSTSKSLDADKKVQNDECIQLNKQFENMKKTLDKTICDINGTNQKLQKITTKNDQLKVSLDETKLNLRKVNEKLEKIIKKEKNEKNIINEQLANLKTSYAEDKKILSDEIGGVAESLNSLSVKQDEYAKQFGTLKEMIIQQAAKIPALRSNSVHFIWKIDYFNTSNYVESVPFYSDKFGYKMSLETYCKGDGKGTGTGTHLPVYLSVEKGENDEILDWPVRFTGELSLLDQSKQNKHHSLKFSSEDKDDLFESLCVCRFPKFISLDELKRYYLVNNTIFLKANITFTE